MSCLHADAKALIINKEFVGDVFVRQDGRSVAIVDQAIKEAQSAVLSFKRNQELSDLIAKYTQVNV